MYSYLVAVISLLKELGYSPYDRCYKYLAPSGANAERPSADRAAEPARSFYLDTILRLTLS